MFAVGETVGDYEIVAKLKAGGMATLFLGRRVGVEGFSRHVALKVVHEHLANDPMFVQMFVDEALLSSRIQHPNVVHVEELSEVRGRHFLAMEYVHGCALSGLLQALRKRGRTMTPELATYIAVQVAEGLHAAHEVKGEDGRPLGVVHRDVTPQNVLLAYRGHVKLIDFGVAKARGRAQQTTGGSLKGKIAYMSPEQAFGKPLDRRADVYALGVVLWEVLTGRRAFVAENDFALLELVRDPKLPPPSAHNPFVPAALDEVVSRATARDPEDRFETAQQMRRALVQALPSALALDASDLEKLLVATLGESMEADRRALPESVSGVVSAMLAPPDGEEIVRTLTVSAAGLSLPQPDGATPSGVRGRLDPPSLAPPSFAPAGDASAHGAPSRRGLGVALGVGLVLAAAAGVGLWIFWPSPAPMQVTELPRAAREAPVEVEPAPEVEVDVDPSPPAPATAEVEVEADEASTPAAGASEEEASAEPAEVEPEEPAVDAPARNRRPRRPPRRPRPEREQPSEGPLITDDFF